MAGDKQFTTSGTKLIGRTKIYELSPAGCVNFNAKKIFVGFCGNADNFGNAIHWLNNPDQKPPKVKNIEMLMLNNRKEIFHATTLSNWMFINQPFFAIGSGMQFAIAAMEAGKTPYEAVKIASKHDPHTGMGFNHLDM